MSEVQLSKSSDVVVTSVASSASSVPLVAARASRKKLMITNASTAILYVLIGGGTATATTAHSVQIPTLGTITIDGFTGALSGIWAAANGSCQVTEFL